MARTRIEIDQIQETRKITSGEEAAGYLLLDYAPASPHEVIVFASNGPAQINKACLGTSGETPDFEIKNILEMHINGNGGATGLSGHIMQGDTLVIYYDFGNE